MKEETARQVWSRLDGRRQPMLLRCTEYAGLTLPRIMDPLGADEMNSTANRDYQSLGAQAVNHIVNKIMLTMFAPSRPFIRFGLEADERAKMQAQGLTNEEIEAALYEGEMAAVRELDNRPARPKLHEALLHLVVTGNCLNHLPRDGDPSVYGLRDYVVRRDRQGDWRVIVLMRKHQFQDLEPDIQEFLDKDKQRYQPESPVSLYTYIRRIKDRVVEELYVEDKRIDLPDYKGSYTIEENPWHPEVWNLRSGANYGTGLVEDFSSDLVALSTLSKSMVDAAILVSEFRWLLRPGATTSPTDLQNSANGAIIPGEEGDLFLAQARTGTEMRMVKDVADEYVRRIGYGFLLNSAVTRDAERVTAEEIRQQALELETALGGVYSRLAGTFQLAVARWLIGAVKINLKNTKLKLRIITGLDALSRNGDLAALRAALADIVGLQNLGPAAGELNLGAVIKAIFMGHGVRPGDYLKTAEQKQAEQEQAMQQQAQASGLEAGAQRIARGPQ